MAKEFSELYSGVYKSFIITTIIAFSIGTATTGLTSFGCYQVGYSVCAIAIMLILIKLLYSFVNKQGSSSSGITFFVISPFVVMLFCIGFILYLNMKYRDIILDGHVSSGYYTFNNVSVILLVIQLCIIYSIVTSTTFEEKGINPVTCSSILLLGILTGITINIIHTILKYFTTDGFQ
jgi:hypothetical protein